MPKNEGLKGLSGLLKGIMQAFLVWEIKSGYDFGRTCGGGGEGVGKG